MAYDNGQYWADQLTVIPYCSFAKSTMTTNADGTASANSKVKFFKNIKLTGFNVNLQKTPTYDMDLTQKTITLRLVSANSTYAKLKGDYSTGTAGDLLEGTILTSTFIPAGTGIFPQIVYSSGGGTKGTFTANRQDLHIGYQERW